MTIEIPEGYESLGLALGEAVAQASRGKGAERHAESGEKFSDQLIMSIPKRLGDGGECFCLGQALKKICESRRLPPDRARAELLGAINYIAAAWGLLGGFADVMGPAPEGRAFRKPEGGVVSLSVPEIPKSSGSVCLGFAERVVSLMKEAGVREVSFAHPGACIRADGTVTGLHFTTESVSAPEDMDALPHFEKGELVEYEARDGKWRPAVFLDEVEDGLSVLEDRGRRVKTGLHLIRKAGLAG